MSKPREFSDDDIAEVSDHPEWSADELARARPFGEVFPNLVAATSRMTGKGETMIPERIRQALKLEEGDELEYAIDGERAILTKAVRRAAADPFKAFEEWDGEADQRSFSKLSPRS